MAGHRAWQGGPRLSGTGVAPPWERRGYDFEQDCHIDSNCRCLEFSFVSKSITPAFGCGALSVVRLHLKSGGAVVTLPAVAFLRPTICLHSFDLLTPPVPLVVDPSARRCADRVSCTCDGTCGISPRECKLIYEK